MMRIDMVGFRGMAEPVRDDFLGWLERVGLLDLKPVELVVEARTAIGVLSMVPRPKWVVTATVFTGALVGRGKNRSMETTTKEVEVDEFPPQSTWRYFREIA